MKPGFTERVQARLSELGLTPRSASLSVSTNPDLFRNVLRFGDRANPKQGTLALMARALGWTVEDLTGATAGDAEPPRLPEVRPADATHPPRAAMPRDIPVLGTAAGAELGKGAFQLSTDVVEFVARPPGLATARDVYALYVEGDSMVPRFDPGDLVFVNPHRKVRGGDYVVIQEPDTRNGDMQAFIKQLVALTPTLVRTRQFNPPSNIDFVIRPGLRVHRVLTPNELYGI